MTSSTYLQIAWPVKCEIIKKSYSALNLCCSCYTIPVHDVAVIENCVHILCFCVVWRLPKDQDCHELWSRMMKKALRERMARAAGDQTTALDTRNSSSAAHPKTTAPASFTHSTTSMSGHNCVSMYPKNTVAAANSSRSTLSVSSDVNVPILHDQRPSWASHSATLQNFSAGHRDKPAVHQSLSSSSLKTSDSSYFTQQQQQPAATRQFDLRHHIATSSSHAHAPTAKNHWYLLPILWYLIMISSCWLIYDYDCSTLMP